MKSTKVAFTLSNTIATGAPNADILAANAESW